MEFFKCLTKLDGCRVSGHTMPTWFWTNWVFVCLFFCFFSLTVNGLLCSKCQLLNYTQWPIYIINSVNNTKFIPCYTLPLTQHHSFFRNLPPLPAQQSSTQHEQEKKNFSVLISFSKYCHCSCIRILFYPFFACLTADNWLVGSLPGFLYVTIRWASYDFVNTNIIRLGVCFLISKYSSGNFTIANT